VNGFDANVGVGVGGLGLRTQLIENSHWVVQTPAAVWAGRCLPFGVLPQAAHPKGKGLEVAKTGIILHCQNQSTNLH
jgi:hypothetical protein